MKILKELVYRNIAGDHVLVPVGSTTLEDNGLFVLTETGARIWELLPGCETPQELVQTLLEEYDAPEDVLAADVDEFLQKLQNLGILERADT